MWKPVCLLLLLFFLASCHSQQAQQENQKGLRKIRITNQEEIQQLREAGAEIVVQEAGYVIVRTDNMVSALSVGSEPITEQDLVQRLVYIHLQDSTDLQKVINIGVDLWEVRGDTAVARAFDLYIEQLRAAGLSVEIVAADASKMENPE